MATPATSVATQGGPPAMPSDTSRILVVDDDPCISQLVERYLAGYAFSLLAAADGEAGVQLAIAERPDLILLDLNMPKLDGFGACSRLKSDPRSCDIPVIIFTAREDITEKKQGFQLGAVDYITKPVEQPELLARINIHIGQARLRGHLLHKLEYYEGRFGLVESTNQSTSAGDLPEHRLNRVEHAREILERNPSDAPSLEQLAQAVNTNGKRLSKDFQHLYGMTVFAWLREHRLQRAAHLLRTSQTSITSIADQLGFSSSAKLSTLFKQRFHLTPRQYRGPANAETTLD